MKKLIIASLALAMLFGCKKGENDPGISFRSRDARIVGEWKIGSFEKESKTVDINYTGNPAVLTTKTKVAATMYDGSKVTVTTTNAGTTKVTTDTVTYAYSLNIEKDGNCTFIETASKGGVTSTYTSKGTWLWANSKKNKSFVNFNFTDISPSNLFSSGLYRIDQLKNKEMVLISNDYDNDETTSKAGTSTENTNTSKFTFTQ